VVLTTHYLDEADALADRVLVMDGGEIVANDTPDALKARISGDVVTLGLPDPDARAKADAVVREAVAVREVVASDVALLVTVDEGAVAVAPLLRALDAAGLSPTSITVNRPTLDDVFLTLTGHSLREGSEAA
jgi:ABC-2 type transport system ATP-binding protein